jgi:hypothetical protein
MILLGIGLTVAFLMAWIAVKIFLKIVENYGFKHFGYYRIIIGIIFLIMMKYAALVRAPRSARKIQSMYFRVLSLCWVLWNKLAQPPLLC